MAPFLFALSLIGFHFQSLRALGSHRLFLVLACVYASFLGREVTSLNTTVRTLYEITTRRGCYRTVTDVQHDGHFLDFNATVFPHSFRLLSSFVV